MRFTADDARRLVKTKGEKHVVRSTKSYVNAILPMIRKRARFGYSHLDIFRGHSNFPPKILLDPVMEALTDLGYNVYIRDISTVSLEMRIEWK